MTSPDIAGPPPLSRIARIAAGVSLVLAGLTNGLPQYLGVVFRGSPPARATRRSPRPW
jgi:hypothetical protein